MRIRVPRPIALLALALSPSWGCGGPAEGPRVETVPVKGKMTYKGRPLAKGVVQFDPEDDGRPARGDLQPDGTFVLHTLKDGDGAPPGRHQVSVSGTGSTPAGLSGAKGARELVPMKYTQRKNSGLQADVGKDNTEFTFDLK